MPRIVLHINPELEPDHEAQMMAMSVWTDPKMPAHYIAKAKRDKLGASGGDKQVAFDRSQETT